MAYGVEIWVEREELEKIMLDYVRQIFNLEFCTSSYLITRELVTDKLRVGWGIKARRNEEKIKRGKAGKIAEWCWEEKKINGMHGQIWEEKGKFL